MPNPIPTNVALSTSIPIYRRELERQRDLLRTITWWYLLPMLPGMLVLTFGQAVVRAKPVSASSVLGFFLLTGLLVRQLNLRVARKLQQKIDALSAAGKQP